MEALIALITPQLVLLCLFVNVLVWSIKGIANDFHDHVSVTVWKSGWSCFALLTGYLLGYFFFDLYSGMLVSVMSVLLYHTGMKKLLGWIETKYGGKS